MSLRFDGQVALITGAGTKAAMIGLARAIARDIGEEADIRINVITPAAWSGMSSKEPAEAASSFGSGQVLMPEMFAALPEMVDRR